MYIASKVCKMYFLINQCFVFQLKGLLKEAFDDLIDDDLLSVTSEDSANISGCSERFHSS